MPNERRRISPEMDNRIQHIQYSVELVTGQALSYPSASELAARLGMGNPSTLIIMPRKRGKPKIEDFKL